MAQHRAEKSGINADVQSKLEEMYDVQLEIECRYWMEAVTGEPFPECTMEELAEIERDFPGKEFHLALKNGVYLCKLIRQLYPNAFQHIKLSNPTNPFHERDLIQHFLKACVSYGVRKDNLFETEDLHSAVNMNMVVSSIIALGSTAQTKPDYIGPKFGPRYSEKNERIFSKETLQERETIVPLQSGTNRGASQSGMRPYGQMRQIFDPNMEINGHT